MNEAVSIILNRHSRSGRGAEIFQQAEKELKRRGIRYAVHETRRAGDATQLAKTLCKSTFGDDPSRMLNLIVIGGDGTINETINGLTDLSRVRFGLIPTGSGNDFAREMQTLPSAEACMAAILDDLESGREPDRIDVGCVSYGDDRKRRFCISSGIGMDAMATKLADRSPLKKVLNKLHLGSAIYVIETIRALFTMDTAHLDLEMGDTVIGFDKLIFTAAMNCKAEGGGVKMVPKADARDGLLSVCVVNDVPKWKTFFLLIRLAMARHESLKCFHFYDTEKVTIRLDHPMTLHTDGEYLGDFAEVSYEALPGALQMIGLRLGTD